MDPLEEKGRGRVVLRFGGFVSLFVSFFLDFVTMIELHAVELVLQFCDFLLLLVLLDLECLQDFCFSGVELNRAYLEARGWHRRKKNWKRN